MKEKGTQKGTYRGRIRPKRLLTQLQHKETTHLSPLTPFPWPAFATLQRLPGKETSPTATAPRRPFFLFSPFYFLFFNGQLSTASIRRSHCKYILQLCSSTPVSARASHFGILPPLPTHLPRSHISSFTSHLSSFISLSCLPPCAAISDFCPLVLPCRTKISTCVVFLPSIAHDILVLSQIIHTFASYTHANTGHRRLPHADTQYTHQALPFLICFPAHTPLASSLLGPSLPSPQWPPILRFCILFLSQFFSLRTV